MQSGERLVAPPLLLAESTSVLRRYVFTEALEHAEAVAALRLLLGMPIEIEENAVVYQDALDFANRLGHAKGYDTQYLAVARLHDCPVVTCDRGLATVAQTLKLKARLLR